MKTAVSLVCIIAIVLLAGCAAGPNELVGTPRASEPSAGFLWGLWHGVIAPVAFIVSLFNHHVQVYEVHNNGGWYNFGFLLGISMIFGGGAGGAARGRRRG